MEKEYISTIVIDSESAAKDWHAPPTDQQDECIPAGDKNSESEQEFSGVHTWVS